MTDHKYGSKGHIIDAFIEHLKGMTKDDWARFKAAWDAAGEAAGEAVWDAVGTATRDAVWDAVGTATRDPVGTAAVYAVANAVWDAVGTAAVYAVGTAAVYAAVYAAWEIQGADLMRERNQLFFFLSMFGFADEQAVLAALQPKEDK